MSASLVGSEMCIRDSSCRGRLRNGSRGITPLGFPQGPQEGKSFLRGAVSYTHLTLPTICSV
eukprot:7073770-Alexandrium_andersonii.AAC.1